MHFERILVPVDFSEYSDAAVRIACALSRRGPTIITLLHVMPERSTGVVAVEPFFVPPRIAETLYQERLASAEADLEAAVGRARAAAFRGTEVEPRMESGDTHIVVRDIARSHDLIVAGSHGLSGAARFLLGSTSEKIAREAPCPVIVTGADSLQPGQVRRFERVLIGIDYAPPSERIARIGAAIADDGAEVELLHVWAPPSQFVLGGDSSVSAEIGAAIEEQRSVQADRLAATAAILNLPGIRTTTFIASGPATAGILDRASEIEADLIVVGTHARETLTEKVLGTVADRVLRHAECAVLLVPPPADAADAG